MSLASLLNDGSFAVRNRPDCLVQVRIGPAAVNCMQLEQWQVRAHLTENEARTKADALRAQGESVRVLCLRTGELL